MEATTDNFSISGFLQPGVAILMNNARQCYLCNVMTKQVSATFGDSSELYAAYLCGTISWSPEKN